MWTEKYRPAKPEDILGNPKVAADLKGFDWKKPAIVHGPTGVGKTALVKALASALELDIVEITNENIESGRKIAETRSLFGDRKLVLIDNVEQITKIKEVSEIISASRNPLVMTSTEYDAKKLTAIKKTSVPFQMKRPMAASVAKLLESICAREGVEAEKEALKSIAEKSQGDIRAAINDLETVARGRHTVTVSDTGILEGRDKVSDIYRLLSTIMLKKDVRESLTSVYDVDEQPQDVLMWVDENLPAVVRGPCELQRTYECLSRADVFLGRIASRQYWGFQRYANAMMTSGITAFKGEKVSFARYQFPFYIIRMGQTKKERNLKKSIGLKLSPEYHCSSKDAAREYIPLLRTLIKAGRMDVKDLAETYEFDDDESAYLEDAI